ncbi:unnamed protein product [Ixodes pacificus]
MFQMQQTNRQRRQSCELRFLFLNNQISKIVANYVHLICALKDKTTRNQ